MQYMRALTGFGLQDLDVQFQHDNFEYFLKFVGLTRIAGLKGL